jgi:hypothetical protein
MIPYIFGCRFVEKRENKVSACFFEIQYLHSTFALKRTPHPENELSLFLASLNTGVKEER